MTGEDGDRLDAHHHLVVLSAIVAVVVLVAVAGDAMVVTVVCSIATVAVTVDPLQWFGVRWCYSRQRV